MNLQRLGEADLRDKLAKLRRWGRWGSADQRGAVNLITPAKVISAAQLVRLGRTVSLARELPAGQPRVKVQPGLDGSWGVLSESIDLAFHGTTTTHIDALCHMWDGSGMWNDRDPAIEVTDRGVTWAGIENWSDGIVTRGVFLDVAGARDDGYVDLDRPVTAEELAAVASGAGIAVEPGDALVIFCGRDRWEQATNRRWGVADEDGDRSRPGLDTSCVDFFHDVDCSAVIWDMHDTRPNQYQSPQATHTALFNQGIALMDNAYLETLAEVCRTNMRTDFMITVAPLRIVGGSGSPVNPLAIL